MRYFICNNKNMQAALPAGFRAAVPAISIVSWIVVLTFSFGIFVLSGCKKNPVEPNPVSVQHRVYGLDFGPFMDEQDPNRGAVVSEEQVRERMGVIAPYTTWIRTFGMDGGLAASGRIAREYGLKAALGAWLSDDMIANEREMDALIAAAIAGEVDLAIVGSETLPLIRPCRKRSISSRRSRFRR